MDIVTHMAHGFMDSVEKTVQSFLQPLVCFYKGVPVSTGGRGDIVDCGGVVIPDEVTQSNESLFFMRTRGVVPVIVLILRWLSVICVIIIVILTNRVIPRLLLLRFFLLPRRG